MEVEAISGEVKYCLRIPHLSTYTEDDELTTKFSLSMGGLRSRWQVTVQPFLPSKPHKPHDMNSDVGITLTCLGSSIAFPHIDIYCNVAGRGQAHDKKVEQVTGTMRVGGHAPPTWQGVLVPRLALRVFDLLPQDTLTATLRFVVRADDVWRFDDPLEELSTQLKELRKGKYSDITILTSDGAAIPAHSSILRARSELLRGTSHEVKRSPDIYDELTTTKSEKERPETPLSSTFGSDLSYLSGYHSLSHSSLSSSGVFSPSGHQESSLVGVKITSASPFNAPTPRRLFTPSDTTGEDKRDLSPCKSPLSTPKRLFTSSLTTGDKRNLSPCKSSISSTSNTPRRPFSPSQATGDKRNHSPCKSSSNKRPTPRVTPSSPRRRILQRENETPRRSPFPPVPCQSVHSSTSCTPSKAPLKEMEVNVPRLAAGHTLNLNMSASVARAMLDWIYTGEANRQNSLRLIL